MSAASTLPQVPHTVYSLVDPISDTVRYVGMTNNLTRRVIEHLSLRGSNLRLKAWIAGLAVAGYVPLVKVLDLCESREVALMKEVVHIASHSETIYNLVA